MVAGAALVHAVVRGEHEEGALPDPRLLQGTDQIAEQAIDDSGEMLDVGRARVGLVGRSGPDVADALEVDAQQAGAVVPEVADGMSDNGGVVQGVAVVEIGRDEDTVVDGPAREDRLDTGVARRQEDVVHPARLEEVAASVDGDVAGGGEAPRLGSSR